MNASPIQIGPMQVPSNWDAVASSYAKEAVSQMEPYAKEMLRRAAPRRSDRVLDVATGPGTLAFTVAPSVAEVIAVDFSAGMIEEVKMRAERERIANINAHVMDAEALKLRDEDFDLAFCMFGFMFFPNRARAFREIYRVLRGGGRGFVATWAPLDRRPLMKIAFDALADALPDLPRPAKGDLQDPVECIREMSDAGFREVSAVPFSASVRIDSPEHYVRVMEGSGAHIAALKKKLGEAAWEQARGRFLEAVRERIPAEGTVLGAEAIITCGTR